MNFLKLNKISTSPKALPSFSINSLILVYFYSSSTVRSFLFYLSPSRVFCISLISSYIRKLLPTLFQADLSAFRWAPLSLWEQVLHSFIKTFINNKTINHQNHILIQKIMKLSDGFYEIEVFQYSFLYNYNWKPQGFYKIKRSLR